MEDLKRRCAIEQGVEEKYDKKLDWMYKGPNQIINREEYLLGRPVDKAFEQMQQAEKDVEQNKTSKNHVEYECIPPSLRFFSGNEQVDLARKMQEDPLYVIKKKEIETRNQLLKNPVKLKQLKELLEQQSTKNKSQKKKKKLKEDSSEDEVNLDLLLTTKYKQLKDNISTKDLIKSMKKIKHKETKALKKRYRDSESEEDSNSDHVSVKKKRHKRRKKQKRNTSDSESDSDSTDSSTDSNSKSIVKLQKEDSKKKHDKLYLKSDIKLDDYEKRVRKTKTSEDKNSRYEESKRYKEYSTSSKRRYDNNEPRDSSRNKYDDKRKYSATRQNDTMISNSKKIPTTKSISGSDKFKDRNQDKYKSKVGSGLTEKEKEQRRKEMMANAVWRDKEREKNVKVYREQEKKEEQNTSYNKDFIRKQLVVATEMGTVASRIKANINNIQRFGQTMNTNFAKR
ncbi:hypothetical protein PUN28_013478 [Cardiocondyla obscurior]